jgi:hypothetical protein
MNTFSSVKIFFIFFILFFHFGPALPLESGRDGNDPAENLIVFLLDGLLFYESVE